MPDFDLDSALTISHGFNEPLPFPPEVEAVFRDFWTGFQSLTGTRIYGGCVSSVGGDPLDWRFGFNLACMETWAANWERYDRPPNLPRSWSKYPPEWDGWVANLQEAANQLATRYYLPTKLHVGYTSYVPNYGVLAYVSGQQGFGRGTQHPVQRRIYRA